MPTTFLENALHDVEMSIADAANWCRIKIAPMSQANSRGGHIVTGWSKPPSTDAANNSAIQTQRRMNEHAEGERSTL